MSFDSKRVVFAPAIDRSEKMLVRLQRYDGLRRERLIFFALDVQQAAVQYRVAVYTF